MAENTPFNKVKWYTCPVCTEAYDIDCWEGRSSCVCCGARFSREGAKNTEQQLQPDNADKPDTETYRRQEDRE